MTNDELVKRLRENDLNLSDPWRGPEDQNDWCDKADELMSEAASAIEDLQRQLAEKDEALKEAVEALKPFAGNSEAWADFHDAERLVEDWPEAHEDATALTVGDLRRAAAIVTKHEGDKG